MGEKGAGWKQCAVMVIFPLVSLLIGHIFALGPSRHDLPGGIFHLAALSPYHRVTAHHGTAHQVALHHAMLQHFLWL